MDIGLEVRCGGCSIQQSRCKTATAHAPGRRNFVKTTRNSEVFALDLPSMAILFPQSQFRFRRTFGDKGCQHCKLSDARILCSCTVVPCTEKHLLSEPGKATFISMSAGILSTAGPSCPNEAAANETSRCRPEPILSHTPRNPEDTLPRSRNPYQLYPMPYFLTVPALNTRRMFIAELIPCSVYRACLKVASLGCWAARHCRRPCT